MTQGLGRAFLVLVVATLLVASLLLGREDGGPLVVSGLLEGAEIRVGSRVGGRVEAVLVEEGDTVAADQVLVRLEPFDLAERIRAAEAELRARESQLAVLREGARPQEIAVAAAARDEAAAQLDELRAGPRPEEITVAREAVALAESERALAEREKDRLVRLVEGDVATEEELDAQVNRWQVAEARLRASRAELSLLEDGTRAEVIAQGAARLARAEENLSLIAAGARAEEIARAEHEVDAARATVAALERARGELEIRAPRASLVDALDLEPGDLVIANAPVLSLRDRAELRVRSYVPEPALRLVAEGTRLEVRVDGYDPEAPFHGRVTFVESKAEFTPGNVQTPEERHDLVFRIRVSLDLSDPRAAGLRPGMHADVVIPEVAGEGE